MQAMFKIEYGLFVLSAADTGHDNGCIVNTVQQVTSSPNRISVTVNKQNLTHDMILSSGAFNVSVLTESTPFSVFENFGYRSGRAAQKFTGSERRLANGALLYSEYANAFFECRVENSVDLGTHTMFIASVLDCGVLGPEPSVSYNYYQLHIKPAPQAVKKTCWRCRICGYIYEGEELPADFICPICKHGAADFEKITV